ncbi:hypothetical protein A7D00_7158 [Trichophyton violaceum]|uniref:NADH-ubiquinone oxidoreductase B15 subunit n=1 Tax=Trichophyton violaceum TaxID=34388 RepID=A0A178FBH2_TRIVO|nr:hypothetical protein A7D00_7158 [Trichophyton violaceum]
MAGPSNLHLDPALQKYYGQHPSAYSFDRSVAFDAINSCISRITHANLCIDTHKNRYKYFRWTPRTAWLSFCYMAVIPGIIGYISYKTDGKYNFRGKRRGDTIAEF